MIVGRIKNLRTFFQTYLRGNILVNGEAKKISEASSGDLISFAEDQLGNGNLSGQLKKTLERLIKEEKMNSLSVTTSLQ